ncbi:DinB family protein [Peribacillus alkalitolerans]|uniref:DinB family protein n=1 Tax=Peribacillus alkalitolerans TaxID=1550385 RepID=UPI0013D68008|nr:DinB family protein [Peribacillus alkalitolerans]
MNTKDLFLEQISLCHNTNGWFVSLKHALSGLSSEQASWKNGESSNSIHEIVNHLSFWNQRYLNRFKGVPIEKMEGNNDTTFHPNHLEWAKALNNLEDIMQEWVNVLQECEIDKMESPLDKETTASWASVLANLTLHTAYHIGQIVHIRKQQGSWDPTQGVH